MLEETGSKMIQIDFPNFWEGVLSKSFSLFSVYFDCVRKYMRKAICFVCNKIATR